MKRYTIGIVADDLTGATDALIQFRSVGLPGYLLLGETSRKVLKGKRLALALVSNTRCLDKEGAAEETSKTIRKLLDANVSHLYLKIDSTMRGSVAGQIDGALESWSLSYPGSIAIVCPSYPRMGRVVRGGNVYVNGVPVERSAAGSDPVTPVRTSRMTRFVPRAVQVEGDQGAKMLARQVLEAAPGGGIVSVNAENEDDLRRVAEAAKLLHPQSLCVGSAGLARHLAHVWHRGTGRSFPADPIPMPRGRVVVCVSSRSDISLGQTRHLNAVLGANLVGYEVSAIDLSNSTGLRNRVRMLAAQSDARVILVQPDPWLACNDDRVTFARAVAHSLAISVSTLLASSCVTGLVLVGGDGADAALGLVGAQALEMRSQLSEGVPLTRVIGGSADGLTVVTKAGAFGSITTITDAVSALLGVEEGVI